MYKLFTDKTELFECDIKLEGASLKDSQARLLIESDDLNLMFKGTIDASGKCAIPIRKLKGLLDESISGNIKLEVIADDTYFTPWESKFEVDTSRKVTVEVKSQQNATIISESKPKVSVSQVKNNTISLHEREHVIKLLRLLIKEDISLKNLSIEKNKLNNIVGTYLQENDIVSSQKPTIIEGVLLGLQKINE